MEENFRNTLIIISAVIIGAIFVHGLWTIRKAKNPYKLKTSKQKVSPMMRGFDNSGFDQDGVSKVKVKSQANKQSVSSTIDSADNADLAASNQAEYIVDENISAEVISIAGLSVENKSIEETSLENIVINNSSIENDSVEELSLSVKPFAEVDAENQPESTNENKEPQVSVYQTPITRAKPDSKVAIKLPKRPGQSKSALKRNQMEINFGDVSAVDNAEPMSEPVANIDETSQPVKAGASLEPQVIALCVMVPENQFMAGASLLPSLLTMGMKYGEMNIFHRHQDNAGNGDITFSLANMMKPGTFNLDTMETFATQGVSLFMTLPNAGNPFEVYQQMLSAAKNLAQEFNGKVHDDKRNVLTKQSEQHYLSKIREFDRKNRIAAAE